MKKIVTNIFIIVLISIIISLNYNTFATSIENFDTSIRINKSSLTNKMLLKTKKDCKEKSYNTSNCMNSKEYNYISPYSKPLENLIKGQNGEHVKWLQDMLIHCKYDLVLNGEFDDNTYDIIIDFQTKNELQIDGIVGEKTINKLIEIAKISYIPNSYNSNYPTIPSNIYLSIDQTNKKEYVKWLQDMLRHCGYQLSVDGQFGSKTNQAVKNFQMEKNLTVNGVVDSRTINQLKLNATEAFYSTENSIPEEIYGTFTTELGITFKDIIYHEKTNNRYFGECLEFALATAVSGYVPSISAPNLLLELENIVPYFRSGDDSQTGNLNEIFEYYNLNYIRLNENYKSGGLDYIIPLRNWIMDSNHIAILYLECPKCSDTCKHSSGIVGNSGTVWTKKHHWITIAGYRYNQAIEKDQVFILDNSSSVVSYKNSTGKWYNIDEFANIEVDGNTYTSEIRRMYLISN